MYRHGHIGITLLILVPISYALIQNGQFALTELLALGILIIEPLPDNDHWIPGLSHRGVSHSLLTACLIGLLCAGCGWLLGRYLTVPLAHWMLTAVLPATNITAVAIATEQLAALTPETLAGLGFVIGVLGICMHLAGDIITVSGIQPFLPFSRRRISLSRLRAASTLANIGRYVGLDTSGSAFYLATWQDDDSDALQDRLDRIRTTAAKIIEVVEQRRE